MKRNLYPKYGDGILKASNKKEKYGRSLQLQDVKLESKDTLSFRFYEDGWTYNVNLKRINGTEYDLTWVAISFNGDKESDVGHCIKTRETDNSVDFEGYWFEEYDWKRHRNRIKYDMKIQIFDLVY